MAIITFTCQCGKTTKIDIKTIDELRKENKRLTEEAKDLKAKIAALEYMKKNKNNFNMDDIFKGFNL